MTLATWIPRTLLIVLAAPAVAGGARAQQLPAGGDRVYTVGDTLVGAVGGVAVDAMGYIYAADFRETVYKIAPDGRARVFATGLYGASGNAVDGRGRLYQSSFNGNYISRIDRHGNHEVVAEGLAGPVGIAVDGEELVVCNCGSNTLARARPDGAPEIFVESPLLNCPNGITKAGDGNFYVANFSDGKLLRVTPAGEISELATVPGGGNGHVAFARGNLYVTSFQGNRIYRVSLDGEVTPVAGTGAFGETDGPALEATFTFPNGIAAGPAGDRLYVNDFINRTPPGVAIPPVPKSTLRVIKLASIADAMVAGLRSDGVAGLEEAYRAWKSDPATAPLFTEIEVNALGYGLMGSGQLEAATHVFELNAESYPGSWNVWDSLAEAHMRAGDDEKAIELYEKSLAIHPGNRNAVRMIAQIRDGGG